MRGAAESALMAEPYHGSGIRGQLSRCVLTRGPDDPQDSAVLA